MSVGPAIGDAVRPAIGRAAPNVWLALAAAKVGYEALTRGRTRASSCSNDIRPG
jgi:hypothetical protein